MKTLLMLLFAISGTAFGQTFYDDMAGVPHPDLATLLDKVEARADELVSIDLAFRAESAFMMDFFESALNPSQGKKVAQRLRFACKDTSPKRVSGEILVIDLKFADNSYLYIHSDIKNPGQTYFIIAAPDETQKLIRVGPVSLKNLPNLIRNLQIDAL